MIWAIEAKKPTKSPFARYPLLKQTLLRLEQSIIILSLRREKESHHNEAHIIQCDADIQEDKKITCQEDFDEYLKTMQIRGLGGTDFRPVFEHVETLRQNREFTNLKGLIYFTDGYGAFLAKKPDYDTAFVFIDDDYNNPDVPPWAIKLVLQKDEI